MSLQLRVLIEVAPSENEMAMARLDQAETVIPISGEAESASDVMALADVALCRMVEDCVTKIREQLVQLGDVMAKEALSQ